MPRWTSLLAAALVIPLAGCAIDTMDLKIRYTSFEPTADGFKYRGVANAMYKVDSPSGEAWRIQVLDSYVTDNRVCPKGYDVVSRVPVLVNKTSLGDVYWVHYQGRCKS